MPRDARVAAAQTEQCGAWGARALRACGYGGRWGDGRERVRAPRVVGFGFRVLAVLGAC